MKKMKREYSSEENSSNSWGNCSSDKAKMWAAVEEEDELFGLLGYTVKKSEMAEVAEKIHQIEMAIWNAPEDGLSDFADDTIHYNPSDISSWLESMRSGIFSLPEFDSSADPFLQSAATENSNSRVNISDRMAVDLDFGSDLIAIPGKAIYPVNQSVEKSHQPPTKKVKTSAPPPASCMGDSDGGLAPPRSLLVDSEENGIRLVHTLMACAEAVQQENLKLAEALVNNIGVLAVSQAGAMRKVAFCFQEALDRRIRKAPTNLPDFSINYKLQSHFYEAYPYLKFAHFTASQAIREAFAGKKHVHVIDFSINQGSQWPMLLQALAEIPTGPTFRLTGIGPPEQSDCLNETGLNLSQLAKVMNVPFAYRKVIVNSLVDLDASMLDIREGETVSVNSIFNLHQTLAHPGAIDKVLQLIRDLKPEIFTVVEQEASHNGDIFYDRFTAALHYYSAFFDSLESGGGAIENRDSNNEEDKAMSEVYLGQQICNVVACDGTDRVERHETLTQWRTRFRSAGFEPVHLGSNVHKDAVMFLDGSGFHGYTVDESNGCLMLGWQNRPLIAASAWRMLPSR